MSQPRQRWQHHCSKGGGRTSRKIWEKWPRAGVVQMLLESHSMWSFKGQSVGGGDGSPKPAPGRLLRGLGSKRALMCSLLLLFKGKQGFAFRKLRAGREREDSLLGCNHIQFCRCLTLNLYKEESDRELNLWTGGGGFRFCCFLSARVPLCLCALVLGSRRAGVLLNCCTRHPLLEMGRFR